MPRRGRAPARLPQPAPGRAPARPRPRSREPHMSAQPDPHAELGVPPGATHAEIHQAFRRRLREHHPDTREPPDAETAASSDQALQRVLAAYQTLRQQRASPPVKPHNEVQPRRPDQSRAAAPPGGPGDPALRASAVHWAPAPGPRPSRYPTDDPTSRGDPWPDLLIRWLLGN